MTRTLKKQKTLKNNNENNIINKKTMEKTKKQ